MTGTACGLTARSYVLDDVPACALDDPGGDGPAAFQGGSVVQPGFLGGQVAGAGIGVFTLDAGVAVGGGAPTDPGGDLGGPALQDLDALCGYPFLGIRITSLEERPWRPSTGIRARR